MATKHKTLRVSSHVLEDIRNRLVNVERIVEETFRYVRDSYEDDSDRAYWSKHDPFDENGNE